MMIKDMGIFYIHSSSFDGRWSPGHNRYSCSAVYWEHKRRRMMMKSAKEKEKTRMKERTTSHGTSAVTSPVFSMSSSEMANKRTQKYLEKQREIELSDDYPLQCYYRPETKKTGR